MSQRHLWRGGQLVPLSAKSDGRTMGLVPRLLVSVRSVIEAERAIAGGADILDVKEPARGSLGMAKMDEISQIAKLEMVASGAIPLSVALGEALDWNQSSSYPALPGGITFAKLGLSQCASKPDWKENWLRVRTAFERRSSSNMRWVAVAYADCTESISPNLAEVLDAAIETGCAGLLIDTWTKAGRTLFDFTDATSITSIANECHSEGLFLAVAGRLCLDSLSTLARVPADILAIRSAACVGTDRTSELDTVRVTEFRGEMQKAAVTRLR